MHPREKSPEIRSLQWYGVSGRHPPNSESGDESQILGDDDDLVRRWEPKSAGSDAYSLQAGPSNAWVSKYLRPTLVSGVQTV